MEAADGFIQFVLVARGEYEVGSGLTEDLCETQAKAAAATGDNDNFAEHSATTVRRDDR